ncbi:glycosyltransferase family A protein [Umezawaea sp. Da 62-37]|uniref:glycosyltransferase family A protein n=1 Tax=Umezawaea sp. Da 62-37 TaxID=3075927 RepID=UPI0028F6E84A|nr:glycosyltransferase family A protein [Umezawaea sp. Da 62-37]WNV84405.1 glycosyltransferase family A protein [Umezawaea sp. Da 62-37]
MPTNRTGVTVVGIPARNEATTVAAVARAADAGLRTAFPDGRNVVVLAENGSTDGTAERFEDTDLVVDKVVVRSGGIGTGKGTNVFEILDQGARLDADRVLLLDADVRSTEPEWIDRLACAVDGQEPAIAVPAYRRNRFEANTTNHLASPLLAAVYGVHVQQPIGGEFAFNRAFVERARTWARPASSYLYGIDVWLTANALRENLRVVEVPLGRKLHNSPFPKILRLPQQVLDSLFHVLLTTEGVRPPAPREPVTRAAIDSASVRPDPVVVAHVTRSVGRYLGDHWTEVCEVFPSARDLRTAPWGLRVGTDEWPELLADAVAGVARGGLETTRDHLVSLYVNRVLTFWEEIEELDGPQIDVLLDRQATETVRALGSRDIALDRTAEHSLFHENHWVGYNDESEQPLGWSVPA